jgi:predicted DNA-binding transcriptional regulator AlpA
MDRSKIKLMGASEIGERLRISRQRTYQLIGRRTFPEPLAVLAMGQVWLAEDVEAWIARERPHLNEDDEQEQ